MKHEDFCVCTSDVSNDKLADCEKMFEDTSNLLNQELENYIVIFELGKPSDLQVLGKNLNECLPNYNKDDCVTLYVEDNELKASMRFRNQSSEKDTHFILRMMKPELSEEKLDEFLDELQFGDLSIEEIYQNTNELGSKVLELCQSHENTKEKKNRDLEKV